MEQREIIRKVLRKSAVFANPAQLWSVVNKGGIHALHMYRLISSLFDILFTKMRHLQLELKQVDD